MSDLQFWLLAIGAGVVVTVLVFNWLQERRFRKQADAAFQKKPLSDALLQPADARGAAPERIEPAMQTPDFGAEDPGDGLRDSEPHFSGDADASREATTAGATPAAQHAVPPRPAHEPAAPYDELIEYRIRVGSHDGVPASAFADALNRARALGKTVRWIGLPAGATVWEEIHPWRDVRYHEVVVTMQLADRSGAVREDQLASLRDVLQGASQAHGLNVVCDDIADALERARAIDHFCVDVDILVGLNVAARGEGALNFERIVRGAEDSGMVLGADGAFQLLDSRGEPLYALCNHDDESFSQVAAEGQTSHGVTLQFDVPRVPDGLKAFDGMVAFGRKLANEIGGILVDDNMRPLTDAGIEKIRTQLMQIYERMEARGVPSGSRRALRLFA